MRTIIPIILLLLAFSVARVFALDATFSYNQSKQQLDIKLGVKITDKAQLQPLTVKLFEDKIIPPLETQIIPTNKINDLNGEAIGFVFNLNNPLTAGKKYY